MSTTITKQANADPITGEPGSHPVGTGVGAVSAGAAGAALGTVFGGPSGSIIGGVIGVVVGSVAGAYAGHGLAEEAHPTDPVAEEAFWREHHVDEPYYEEEFTYDDYAPGYRTGYVGYRRLGREDRGFDEAETELEQHYAATRGNSRLSWEKARPASHAAWKRAEAASIREP